LKDGRTATAAGDHDPQRLPYGVTTGPVMQDQRARRFPAATGLRGNIGTDPDGEPDRVGEFPTAGARSRPGRSLTDLMERFTLAPDCPTAVLPLCHGGPEKALDLPAPRS